MASSKVSRVGNDSVPENAAFKRGSQHQKNFWESFLVEQKVEDSGARTTDIHLICPDGVVPAHSVVLQSVSPFFDTIFASQGSLMFLTPRPILLPDYKVSDIRKLVQFIYTGSVDAKTEEQAQSVKDMIKYFEIKLSSAVECVKVTAPKPTRHAVAAETDTVLFYPFDKKKTVKENLELLKSRPTVNLVKTSANKIATSSAGTNFGNTLNRFGIISTAPSKEIAYKPMTTVDQSKTNSMPVNHHTDSESDDDGTVDDSAYSLEWFMKEAKKCQYCNSKCQSAALASACLTSHNRLRCYFCFKVVRNTEKLFQHFNEKHKKAGRENCLLCPLCEQIVPFKSVSCHVISLHLAENGNNSGTNRNNNRSAGRPASSSIQIQPQSPAKKQKLDEESSKTQKSLSSPNPTGLQKESIKNKNQNKEVDEEEDEDKNKTYALGDLRVTYRKQSICGKIRVLTIQKSRNCNETAVTTVT